MLEVACQARLVERLIQLADSNLGEGKRKKGEAKPSGEQMSFKKLLFSSLALHFMSFKRLTSWAYIRVVPTGLLGWKKTLRTKCENETRISAERRQLCVNMSKWNKPSSHSLEPFSFEELGRPESSKNSLAEIRFQPFFRYLGFRWAWRSSFRSFAFFSLQRHSDCGRLDLRKNVLRQKWNRPDPAQIPNWSVVSLLSFADRKMNEQIRRMDELIEIWNALALCK